MAKTLNNCHIDVNAVDYTANTSKAEVDDTFDDKDTTTYGDSGKKTRIGGLEDGTFNWTILNDYGSAAIDQAMWALRKTLVTVNVWANKDVAVSSVNPRYNATVLVNHWKPIAGQVGDVATVDVSFPVSGGWNRYTTT